MSSGSSSGSTPSDIDYLFEPRPPTTTDPMILDDKKNDTSDGTEEEEEEEAIAVELSDRENYEGICKIERAIVRLLEIAADAIEILTTEHEDAVERFASTSAAYYELLDKIQMSLRTFIHNLHSRIELKTLAPKNQQQNYFPPKFKAYQILLDEQMQTYQEQMDCIRATNKEINHLSI